MAYGSAHPVTTSLEEYGRGVIGGLIFSLPLLLTMEVWWAGFSASPLRLLVGLTGTFLLLLAYNEVAGLRNDHAPIEVVIDSVEELGIGLVVACATLILLQRVDAAMPPIEIAGKIVVEGMVVAIGVSVGTAQLGGRSTDQRTSNAADADRDPEAESGELAGSGIADSGDRPVMTGTVVLSLCGAVLVASNVAPTEEIVVLGTQMAPFHLLLTVALSLVLAAVTLFFSEFHGSHSLRQELGPRPVLQGCLITYATAFLSAAAMLWFFGRFEENAVSVIVGETVVLALPATLGASAGRLLLQ